MRAIIPAASLLVAALSLAVDITHPPPGSGLCRYGGCRFDQIFAGGDAAGAGRDAVAALVNADPANPLVRCAYAQVLSVRGETQQAQSAFDHAVSLGPGMAPRPDADCQFRFHARPARTRFSALGADPVANQRVR